MSKRFLLTLFVSPILVAGTAAPAQDNKMFPGAMCQPQSESDTALVRDGPTGGIFNESAEVTETVFCPIVRDVLAGGAFQYANMIVCIDPDKAEAVLENPATPLICELVSNRRTGEPVDLAVDTPRANEVDFGVFRPNRASLAPITQAIDFKICEELEEDLGLELILLEFARNSVNIESFQAGYYFFRCSLDPQEGVISYRTLEND